MWRDGILPNRVVKLAPGKGSGRLVGGNLSMVACIMGTPFEVDMTGAIVFLEDTHEEPYRIDRVLTQLALGGKFNGIAGFLWGRCTDCESKGIDLPDPSIDLLTPRLIS
jgi:muramoyltetrapeptide carboxypeptidase